MKLKNYLNETESAKEALMKIIKRNGVFADDIDYKLNKLNRNAESYDDFSEDDFKKVKKELENDIRNDIKASIYNYIFQSIPDELDIGKFTKKEFKDSLKTMSGTRILLDKNGLPYEDHDEYDTIMEFYRKYVK